jgi:SAM-dependent methyltransferase
MRFNRKQDAYGREVYDYHRHGTGCEIVEREDGYIDISSGPAAYFRDFDDWKPYEKKAMAFARGRVLDVGCGAGRVSLYLQKKGHDVLGIDISPLAAKVSLERGVKRVRVMSVTGVSSSLGLFDTIVMYGNNFGLLENPKRAKWLLGRFRAITREGARIIATSTDVYNTDKRCHLDYQRANRRRGRMSGQVRLRVRYQTYATPWFDYLLVSPDEMRKLVDGTGWRVAKVFTSRGPVYTAVIERID